jgi:hypothetical protein
MDEKHEDPRMLNGFVSLILLKLLSSDRELLRCCISLFLIFFLVEEDDQGDFEVDEFQDYDVDEYMDEV